MVDYCINNISVLFLANEIRLYLRSVKWTDDTELNETITILIGEDFEFIQESVLMGQTKTEHW